MIQRHKIGLIGAIALVLGNLVGSGAFMLPAAMASHGYVGILGWGFTSLGALLLALIFARLSVIITKTGGPHTYVQHAFNNSLAYYTAWGYWMLTWIGNAAIVVSMYGYFNNLFGGALTYYQEFAFGILALTVMTYINVRGIKEANFIQIMVTILKVLPMVVVPLACIGYFKPQFTEHFNMSGDSNWMAFQNAAVLTLWSYVGIESATVPADDMNAPEKTISRATVIGTLLAAGVYIGGNILLLGAIPHEVLVSSEAPYATAAHFIGGPIFEKIVALAALVCCIGTLNGWMLLVGQIPKGAADDGLFPKYFGKISSRGVPARGIVVSAVLMGVILLMTLDESLTQQFEFIADLAVTSILIIFVIMLGCYYKLRLKAHGHLSDYMIFYAASAYTIWTLYSAGPKMLLYSAVIILSGWPVKKFFQVYKKV